MRTVAADPLPSMYRWTFSLTAAVCGVVLAGCVSTVAGTPRAGSDLTSGPPGTSAPVVGQGRLPALLLDVDRIREVMGGPRMLLARTFTDVLPMHSGETVSDVGCLQAVYPSEAAAYGGSGFVEVLGRFLTEPSETPDHTVFEAVVRFASVSGAHGFVDKSARDWAQCSRKPLVYTHTDGTTDRWDIGDVANVGGVVSVLDTIEGGVGWGCSHQLAARSNVVVDVSACQKNIADQAATILQQISDRFAK
jgi:PknH-like extracellular domain